MIILDSQKNLICRNSIVCHTRQKLTQCGNELDVDIRQLIGTSAKVENFRFDPEMDKWVIFLTNLPVTVTNFPSNFLPEGYPCKSRNYMKILMTYYIMNLKISPIGTVLPIT